MTHDQGRSSELYARVHAILAEARHLSGPELERFLARECGDDEALLREVRTLLDQGHAEADDALSEGVLQAGRQALESVLDEGPAWMPERIGEFTILRRIGHGGMGVVYEAQQEVPRRRVAIKLLHPVQTTPGRVRRFRREAEVLGRLQHPGIAQIFEVGTFDAGRGEQPFFAMELIEGVDIRTHCDRETVDLRGRVELLAMVAEAVQYAHERGVVHRDLKPDNVLVDAKGRPRVLDFGVARVNSQTSAPSTMTAEGQIVGTLAYMAPEVLRNEPGATAQVDVYALGVLAYELLVGQLPHRVEGLDLPQVVAVLTQREARPAGDSDTRLRGDLETILGKALATETSGRYATAGALAGDLRRYLADEPILARPPSRVYRLSKFARRNKALVGGVVATLAASILGAAIAVSYAVDARASSELAEERRREAKASEERALASEADATRRAEEVFRLSALQDYFELVAEADELWPAHPDACRAYEEWIESARALVADLPLHRATLAEVRAGAVPQSDEERRADRRAHPDTPRLETLPALIASRRAALVQRRDGVVAEPFEPDWDTLPASAAALNEVAWPLVSPERKVFGREAEGFALAERGVELAMEAGDALQAASIVDSIAWGHFALGRDAQAREASEYAIELAPEERKQQFQGLLELIQRTIAEVSLPESEAELAALTAELEALESRVNERQTWTFPDTDAGRKARWWHANLTQLIGVLEALEDEVTGLLSEAPEAVSAEHGWSVPRRLRLAQRLRDGVAPAGEWHARWAEATAAIAEDPVYGGLHLSPQVGLVPIGQDPVSGLWEFWHVATGAEPERDPDGHLVRAEQMGVVLVLIPGGSFWMGATRDPEAAHNFDEHATSDEGPVHEVLLSAYFFGKYELTQAQWGRATGTFPSARTLANGRAESLLHPVEQVSWTMCKETLERMGLRLPTEAQWENACRAGSRDALPFDVAEYASYANVKDEAFERLFRGVGSHEPWDDGFGGHGPVGSLRANAFGLHDTLGNVWEWCADTMFADWYFRTPKEDPLAEGNPEDPRVMRGGSFNDFAAATRPTIRHNFSAQFLSYSRGVRAARAVTE